MSSKDKEMISLSKFKQFFRSNKTPIKRHDFVLTPDFINQLRPETPIATRCKALTNLFDIVQTTRMEDCSIQEICELTKDLIIPHKPIEQRQHALVFYKKLIIGQYENLSMMRSHFFRVIEHHKVPEDLAHCLDLLKSLTDNGKDIQYFEEKIGKFMLGWMDSIVKAGLTVPYLQIVVNLIKYNATFMDKEIIIGFIQYCCYLSCFVDDADTVLGCLEVLEVVLAYSIFPNEKLVICVFALCRNVNREVYCNTSHRIMRNLLGTDLGHTAILTMCNILNDPMYYEDAALLRGSVFHINIGLWGSSAGSENTMLKCSPSTVLLSFLNALKSEHIIVTYEVTLSIQSLIKKRANELNEPSWDVICDILERIGHNIKRAVSEEKVVQTFHETLDTLEGLMEKNINADPEKVYSLIETVSDTRPESSVIKLMEYKAARISATRPKWLESLNAFIDRFYKMNNTNIRVFAVQSLMKIMEINRAAYEEEILERVVTLYFPSIAHEKDLAVKKVVVKLLIDFASYCDNKRCLELLDIAEKMMNRPFESYLLEGSIVKSETDLEDIELLTDGLIKVFQLKLYRLPSSHAVRVFHILVGHVEQHYHKPSVFEKATKIRYKIFNWMLKARANASFHIGYPDAVTNQVRFSHYLGIEGSLQSQMQQSASGQMLAQQLEVTPAASFTAISIRRGCKCIVKCMETEKSWVVLQLVLKELPNILQNKALIQGNDVDLLARTLYNLYNAKGITDTFVPKPSQSDFHSLVLPVIASLPTYHQFLESTTQTKIVEALRKGLRTKICVQALTILILEMPDTLVRELPEVLLQMSKLSDTVNTAVAVLEFLSTLSRLPNQRFANFIPVHFMYVFAISLPYTNPYRYDHYTVSLAHHVVAGWFLKCRLQIRRSVVKYIIAGLASYVHKSFQENKSRMDFSQANEDSSNRKRSSSLTEQGSKKRPKPDSKPLYDFHMELAETCIDFLSRHAFSSCSSLPKRLPSAEFLLAGGQSMTWLVGHNLITITTSGCATTSLRNGLCDRCSSLCKSSSMQPQLSKSDSTSSSILPTSPASTTSTNRDIDGQNKRYTKASFQHSSNNDSESIDLTSTSSSVAAGTAKINNQSSQDARFSSSGSLETLSRRGSNPENHDLGEMGKLEGSNLTIPQMSSSTNQLSDRPRQVCACCCTGWAEIYIRRPTGCMSWITRIQNQISSDSDGFKNELPLLDLTGLFMPTMDLHGFFHKELARLSNDKEAETVLEAAAKAKVLQHDKMQELLNIQKEKERLEELVLQQQRVQSVAAVPVVATSTGPIDIPGQFQKRKISRESDLDSNFGNNDFDDDIPFDDLESRSRNPVRRVNSSPEMSSNWKNPFLTHKSSKDANSSAAGAQTQNALQATSTDADNMMNSTEDVGNDVELQQKKTVTKSTYNKDMRVSCEAIPEEMAGSTPPSLASSVSKEEKIPPSNAVLSDQDSLLSKITALEKETESKKIASATKTLSDELNQLQRPELESIKSTLNTLSQINAQSTTTATSLSLKLPTDNMPKVTSKPPQSPAPSSPRLTRNVSAANRFMSTSGAASPSFPANNNQNDMPRGRSKTISVVREHHYRNVNTTVKQPTAPNIPSSRSGISPCFVFLQLYHTGQLNAAGRPLRVEPMYEKALNLFDLIPPFETHKIGVIYVGPGQCNNQTEILKNRFGSLRYAEFLRNLGTLVAVKDAKEKNIFIDLDSSDGNFTYIWQDEIVQVTFHVATLMPNQENDPFFNEKKKHIGNDYVIIVYNESGEEYNLNTIKGQFNYACVIVQPMELNSNKIFVRAKDDITSYVCHSEPKIVSDNSAPLLARQLALHANLASLVSLSLKTTKNQTPYASNWLERLRKIKSLKAKLLKDQNPTSSDRNTAMTSGISISSAATGSSSTYDLSSDEINMADFTHYT